MFCVPWTPPSQHTPATGMRALYLEPPEARTSIFLLTECLSLGRNLTRILSFFSQEETDAPECLQGTSPRPPSRRALESRLSFILESRVSGSFRLWELLPFYSTPSLSPRRAQPDAYCHKTALIGITFRPGGSRPAAWVPASSLSLPPHGPRAQESRAPAGERARARA
jgi:hypothetical protein